MKINSVIALVVLLLAAVPVFSQDSTRAVSFNIESIGFENQSFIEENEIEVYPNPSVNFIVVSIKNSKLRNATFELHSLIGNTIIVYPEEIGQDKFKINIKDINAGYYFVIIKDDFTHFKEAYKFLKK